MLLREDYRARGRTAVGGVYRRKKTRRLRAWLGVLALGAVVLAGAAYLRLRAHQSAPPGATPAAQAKGATERSKPAKKPGPARGTERFQFYSMLPKAEVEVPSSTPGGPRTGTTPQPVETTGTYFLQVGSFATAAEAEAMRRRLASLHVRGDIQPVTVEDKTLQNVRVGPIEDLAELNRVRRVLRDSRIDAGLVRVGD
jgi:cell division protein FtsN